MTSPFFIQSEIGKLQSVLLHRPGKEIENVTPEYLKKLLFDDIPYLPTMQKEHDYFADVLRSHDVEVLYLEKLVSESLTSLESRQSLIEEMLKESFVKDSGVFAYLTETLSVLSSEELVRTLMTGIRKNEIPEDQKKHLCEYMEEQYPFFLDPMPNLYFTRDPGAIIGNGISINSMRKRARRRETLFLQTIFRSHPIYSKLEIPQWFDRQFPFSMEGGDQLVLRKDVVAIGVSERTSPQAIEEIAKRLFRSNSGFQKVMAIQIPKTRAFMHLDTVFTMIDYDKFTVHPTILGPHGEMNIYVLEPGDQPDECKISKRTHLIEALKEVLELPEITLISCGGGDRIASAREQWNDGSNTLAISPGVVVTYDRNYVSNQLLREHGIEVIEIPSSEISRGRGGPRCMSMPLVRAEI